MVTKKEIMGLITPKNNSNATSEVKGGVGYDNPRDNIDPHIKTKVLTTIEGTIQTAPVNSKDIVNKEYVDTGDTAAKVMTNHTAGNHKMFYSNGSGAVVELAHGTSSHVLTSNGATSAPSWQEVLLPVTSPGGSNTHVQFNDSSTFGGDAGFTYNKTTDTATLVNLTLSGALDHDGSTIGFYGVTPTARPSAYTQTYSTTSRTHSNLTSSDLTDSTGGTSSTTLVANNLGDPTIDDNFASVVTQINAIRADITNVKNVLNQVIDDDQLQGLKQ